MADTDNDIEKLKLNGVVALFLVRGGSKFDRHAKAMSFDNGLHMLQSFDFPDAEALLRLENFDFNDKDLPADRVRQIAEAHAGRKSPRIQVVDLPRKSTSNEISMTKDQQEAPNDLP